MAYKVKLTRTQKEGLVEIVRNGKQQAKVILHANVLLQSDCSSEGPALKAKVIAENLCINERTVHRIRRKYAEEGIEAAIQRKPHKKYKPRKTVDRKALDKCRRKTYTSGLGKTHSRTGRSPLP